MRQQVVKLLSKDLQAELRIMIEYRPFDFDQILSNLFLNSFINQPLVWFQTKIVPRKQKGDEQPPGAQRATADVQKAVVLAQSQHCQEIELRQPDALIFLAGPDISPVMPGSN